MKISSSVLLRSFLAPLFLTAFGQTVKADDYVPLPDSVKVMHSAAPLELTYVDRNGSPVFGFALGLIDESNDEYRPAAIYSVCDMAAGCFSDLARILDSDVARVVSEESIRLLNTLTSSTFERWCSSAALLQAISCPELTFSSATSDMDAIVCICPGGASTKCSPGHGCNPGKKCGKVDLANPQRGYCGVGSP